MTVPAASWDLSQIPSFSAELPKQPHPSFSLAVPELPAAVRAKLAVGRVDDPLEQEADRVADQVMRMPAPDISCGPAAEQISRKCAACEKDELQKMPAQPQRAPAEAGGAAQVDMPPLVRDVLAGPGETFDTSTRAFMERRFGHEFGHVRVHADAQAATSARAIDALAYTAGHHIVFGAGQYAPHTAAGRRLLAHELTHVVQQTPPGTIHRQPTTDKEEKAKNERLQTLAENPSQAHEQWARLNQVERTSVVIRMSARYGQDFANSFLWYTKNPKQRHLVGEVTNLSDRTPDWYKARGYQRAWRSQGSVRDQMLDFWVHPSGRAVYQVVDTGVSGQPGPQDPPRRPPPPPPPPPVDCKEIAALMVSILDTAIATETDVQKELEAEKGELEKLNKTTDSYCTRFKQYEGDLKAMNARVDSEIDDIEAMRAQLVEEKCTVPPVDMKLDVLRDFGIWADVESSPVGTQFLQCLKVPDSLPYVDDDS